MAPTCVFCEKPGIVKRPKTGQALCKECFFAAFEAEVHSTIINGQLFHRGEKVAVAASGGKDSTVLACVLKLLNERYDYGIHLVLLSVDEGITGYRDDSLEAHQPIEALHSFRLKNVSSPKATQLVAFLLRLNGPKIGLSIWRMFIVSKDIILALASVFFTYLLLLVQFNVNME